MEFCFWGVKVVIIGEIWKEKELPREGHGDRYHAPFYIDYLWFGDNTRLYLCANKSHPIYHFLHHISCQIHNKSVFLRQNQIIEKMCTPELKERFFEQAEIANFTPQELNDYRESQKDYWGLFSVMETAENKGVTRVSFWYLILCFYLVFVGILREICNFAIRM